LRSCSKIAAVVALLVAFASFAGSAGAASGCPSGQMKVSTGCASRAAAQAHVEAMIREAMPEMGLRASIVQVETGDQALVRAGFGNSMKGTPARPDMYFRIGSMAIPYLIDLLLELEDEGKLSLDDKLAKYRPSFPNAGAVTLRMLASATSGYPDWIQGNEPFQRLLLENPFRQWTSNELLHWAFTMPVVCAPGTCFHYAHTNFAILAQVISQVTGKPISTLMRERFLGPLGLDHTQISRFPAMPGEALHSYTDERGVYEDSTFWSPSWTIGDGTIMASTMGDAIRGAREIGRGVRVSKHANEERLAPITAGMGIFTKHLYYSLGISVAEGWQVQNPFLNGYTGAVGYLPAQDMTVGIVTTQLPRSAGSSTNFATVLLGKLSAYLSPAHVIATPGS
jgi:D-alanyl-D-alanine carboxypeptidase